MIKHVYKNLITFLAAYAFIFISAVAPSFNCINTLETIDSNFDSTIDTAYIHRTHPMAGNYYVYFGSFHNHSGIYGGVGTQEEAFRYARRTAKLDFFGLSDHDAGLDSFSWKNVKSIADESNDDGVFAAFWGFEWTSDIYGHITIINSEDYCVTSYAETGTFAQLCTWLNRRNCAAFFNHPTGVNSLGTEFDHFNGTVCEKIVGMELWNKSVPFSVYYYNEGYDSNDNHKGAFDEAITRGWKVGAAGGSDNHEATWGTANDFRLAILAKNLTRTDLFAALQARRFYSTLDKNLALSFSISNSEMGSTVNSGNSTLEIRASDGDFEKFSEVVLFDKNHNIRRSWNPNTAIVDISDTLNISPGDYFYVKVKQEDENEAISSPIWCANIVAPDTLSKGNSSPVN
jgi:hypothetical protein